MSAVKKALFSGVLLLLPVIITLWVVKFIILFITEPFLRPAHSLVDSYFLMSNPWHMAVDTLLPFAVLLSLFLITCLVGMMAKSFLLRFPIRSVDRLFRRTPYIRRLYSTTGELFQNFMKSKSKLLKHPVIVPFPDKPGRFVMGFLTSKKPLVTTSNGQTKELYPVMLPTAPHPIAGYLLFYPASEIYATDLSAEDAVQFSVSLGTIYDEKKWQTSSFS